MHDPPHCAVGASQREAQAQALWRPRLAGLRTSSFAPRAWLAPPTDDHLLRGHSRTDEPAQPQPTAPCRWTAAVQFHCVRPTTCLPVGPTVQHAAYGTPGPAPGRTSRRLNHQTGDANRVLAAGLEHCMGSFVTTDLLPALGSTLPSLGSPWTNPAPDFRGLRAAIPAAPKQAGRRVCGSIPGLCWDPPVAFAAIVASVVSARAAEGFWAPGTFQLRLLPHAPKTLDQRNYVDAMRSSTGGSHEPDGSAAAVAAGLPHQQRRNDCCATRSSWDSAGRPCTGDEDHARRADGRRHLRPNTT